MEEAEAEGAMVDPPAEGPGCRPTAELREAGTMGEARGIPRRIEWRPRWSQGIVGTGRL